MFHELTKWIDEISPNPLADENTELGKTYKLAVLKTYRALLAGSDDRTHLNKKSAKMKVEEFTVWREALIEKLLKHRPHDDERLLRINAWLVHHLKSTTIEGI